MARVRRCGKGRAPSQCLSACGMGEHNNQNYVAMAHFPFSSLNQNQNLYHSNMSPSPAFLNDACPAVYLPTIFLNNAISSDEEEEQCLFTQPEAEAEAIDNLTEANMKTSDRRLLGRGCILLPTFENEEDADSNIDVGLDEDKEL